MFTLALKHSLSDFKEYALLAKNMLYWSYLSYLGNCYNYLLIYQSKPFWVLRYAEIMCD